MDVLDKAITCPHCGHHFMMQIDVSNGDQDFYEDCPACCNAIHLKLHLDELHEKVQLQVDADDEQVY